VARILIVGGGCRGRRLARELIEADHALRITTRREAGRAAIEDLGAECWVGTPDRLATLRAALDRVAILCWMLGSASGSEEQLSELHRTRVRFFATQAIDTTVRGLVYEAGGSPAELLRVGAEAVREVAERNAIPLEVLTADPRSDEWLEQALAAVHRLLSVP
jgi:uncharacterized protein YbjT (DUF2867 family)